MQSTLHALCSFLSCGEDAQVRCCAARIGLIEDLVESSTQTSWFVSENMWLKQAHSLCEESLIVRHGYRNNHVL